MPFYGNSGANFHPEAGFENMIWHQGIGSVNTVTVETSLTPWPTIYSVNSRKSEVEILRSRTWDITLNMEMQQTFITAVTSSHWGHQCGYLRVVPVRKKKICDALCGIELEIFKGMAITLVADFRSSITFSVYTSYILSSAKIWGL